MMRHGLICTPENLMERTVLKRTNPSLDFPVQVNKLNLAPYTKSKMFTEIHTNETFSGMKTFL